MIREDKLDDRNGFKGYSSMGNYEELMAAAARLQGGEVGGIFEVRQLPKKALLLREGEIADTLYLIRKGCLRLFFYDSKGRDITFQFFFEGESVASFDSMHQGSPSLFSLESLEPSEVVAIRKKDFYGLLEKEPSVRFPFDAPDECCLAIEFHPGSLSHIHGLIRYPAAFNL